MTFTDVRHTPVGHSVYDALYDNKGIIEILNSNESLATFLQATGRHLVQYCSENGIGLETPEISPPEIIPATRTSGELRLRIRNGGHSCRESPVWVTLDQLTMKIRRLYECNIYFRRAFIQMIELTVKVGLTFPQKQQSNKDGKVIFADYEINKED